MAAVSFYAARLPLEIVHYDLSAASIDVARRRVEAHKLTDGDVNVTFRQGSFLDARPQDVGLFDFINSVGVVHHLRSPVDGLRALRGVLRPDGGMFLMVYGELGRTGVYDIQDMWRLSNLSRREFLGGPLQTLLQHLPEANRLALNRRMMIQKVRSGDLTTISDLLVHHCDHAYTVASLLELLAEADLHLLEFADPGKYAVPTSSQTAVGPLLAQMRDKFQRAHFAELLRGDIFMHTFWAAPWNPQAEATVSSDAVLCPAWRFSGYQLELQPEDRARCLREWIENLQGSKPNSLPPASCNLYLDQVGHEGLPCLSVPLLEDIDCERTVGELLSKLALEANELKPGSGDKISSAEWGSSLVAKLDRALSVAASQRQIFIVRPGLRFRRPPWRKKTIPRVVMRRDWDEVLSAQMEEDDEDANNVNGEVAGMARESANSVYRSSVGEPLEL